ncbi:MAG: hypothetical protein ACJ72E_01645 [Marmoricola sp.]
MRDLGTHHLVAVATVTGGLVTLSGPAFGESLQHCLDGADGTSGTVTCNDSNGTDPDSGGGPSPSTIFGIFGAFALLVVLLGVATSVWRVRTARKLAQDAGMDPKDATRMALLSPEGLDATYLAANLRRPVSSPSEPAAASTSDRLAELQRLRDQDLVTQQEYDERRKAIIDSL